MQKLPTLLVVSGLVFLVGAVVFGWIIFPDTVENKILEKVRLQNGTETWENWKNIPIPIYFKVYLFNVTNPEEVMIGGKPNLQESGPYVFEEKRQKVDISINSENDTVKYRQPIFYFFREDLSKGSEDDIVTVLNIPLVGVAKFGSKLSAAGRLLLNMYILRFKEKLFVNRTVKQILFEGYRHDMIAEIHQLTGKEILPNNTFGLLYGKNGTDDNEYEVYSGITNTSDFGRIFAWNGQSTLTWWAGKYCNMINGSDGSLFPPFVKRDRILRIFNSDLCRSLYLTYDRDTEFMGIPGYRFTTPIDLLEDPRINEDNMCFCPNPGENNEGCLKAGAIQLSTCRKGAPLVASTPHFLDGDNSYVTSSIGLNPVRSNHETFIELEPSTGMVIRASKRVQINIDLQPSNALDKFSKIPKMLFPIMWADEYAALTEEKAEDFQSKLILPLKIVDVGKLVVLGISCIFICAGISIFCLRRRNKFI